MADTDISMAIQALDRKIATLTDLRTRLAAEFGMNGARQIPLPIHKAVTGEKTRKEELAQFLRANGAMTRRDIIAAAGMPVGTVAYCLNDKKYFHRRNDKKYEPVEREGQP